ncbi:MAG: ankyrin repeat domain-containing protein [Steroidobacteraceae bacterium]
MRKVPRQVVLVVMALAAATWTIECQASGTRGETTAYAAHTRGLARYSEPEYTRLRRRFEPHQPAARGPLPAWALAATAKAIRMDMYSKNIWPIAREVIYGDTADLNKALEHGLSPSMKIYMFIYSADVNVSLLDVAIEAGQRDVIKLLLAHHASVNPGRVDEDEGPVGYLAPLPYAAQFGEDDVIRVLLAHGANIEQRNNFRGNRETENHETALASAVHNGDVAGVYLLLTRGASARAVLEPPYSCDARSSEIRKLLVAHGAKMPPAACDIGGHAQ